MHTFKTMSREVFFFFNLRHPYIALQSPLKDFLSGSVLYLTFKMQPISMTSCPKWALATTIFVGLQH